jgi:threonyl-tRNA synthetase
LAPQQVIILPISDKFAGYANEVALELKAKRVRVTVDERNEKIGKKIREAEMMRIPYMLIVGEKEMNEQQLSVRRQGVGDTGTVSIDNFVQNIVAEIMERK